MVWIAGIAASMAIFSEPNLIERSRFLMNVGDWNESQYTVGKYQWWSKDEILADGKKEPLLIDFKTGRTNPSPEYGYAESVSPSHYSAETSWSDDHQITWTILDRTGKIRMAAWKYKSLAPRPMMSSDNGFPSPTIQFSNDEKSLFHIDYWEGEVRVNVQVTERKFPNVQQAIKHPVSEIKFDSEVEVIGRKIMLSPYFQFVPQDYWIQEWDIDQTSKDARKWLVSFPKGKRFRSRITSPDQKHSLWVFEKPPLLAESVWVSDLHGENMREIGEIIYEQPGQTKANDSQEAGNSQNFGELKWNPDSKHVSYIFMRKLYMVQAVP